jgi:hypothetical protein
MYLKKWDLVESGIAQTGQVKEHLNTKKHIVQTIQVKVHLF